MVVEGGEAILEWVHNTIDNSSEAGLPPGVLIKHLIIKICFMTSLSDEIRC